MTTVPNSLNVRHLDNSGRNFLSSSRLELARGETSKGSGSKARALKQGLQKNKAKAGFFPSSDQALRPVCIVIVENLAKICKNDSRAQIGQKPKAGSIASFCHTRARPGSTLISSSLAGARQT